MMKNRNYEEKARLLEKFAEVCGMVQAYNDAEPLKQLNPLHGIKVDGVQMHSSVFSVAPRWLPGFEADYDAYEFATGIINGKFVFKETYPCLKQNKDAVILFIDDSRGVVVKVKTDTPFIYGATAFVSAEHFEPCEWEDVICAN